MKLYKVRITEKCSKEFRKVKRENPKVASGINTAIKSLENPFSRPYKKLEGKENVFRIRVGRYRVIYFIIRDKKEVIVISIRPRKSAYK